MSDIAYADERRKLDEVELAIKKAELGLKERELQQPPFSLRSPLIVGAIITALATAGASIVSGLNAHLQRQSDELSKKAQLDLDTQKAQDQLNLELAKQEGTLVFNALQHGGGNPDATAVNLKFLLDAGLIPRTHTRSKLQTYLENRTPGTGAAGTVR